jgi:hypothetical protein
MGISYLKQLISVPHSSGNALKSHIYPRYGSALEQIGLVHAENGQRDAEENVHSVPITD